MEGEFICVDKVSIKTGEAPTSSSPGFNLERFSLLLALSENLGAEGWEGYFLVTDFDSLEYWLSTGLLDDTHV